MAADNKTKKAVRKPRCFTRAIFCGYQRGRTLQKVHYALVQIEGVQERRETEFYIGKAVSYVYRVELPDGSVEIREKNGKVVTAHGNNGMVRAYFKRSLPPHAMGSPLRVQLYEAEE